MTNRLTIVNAYALGDVTGSAASNNMTFIGGLDGMEGGVHINCYSRGNVTSLKTSSAVGANNGLMGGISINKASYYNSDMKLVIAGKEAEVKATGANYLEAPDEASGRTEEEISSQAFAEELNSNADRISEIISDVQKDLEGGSHILYYTGDGSDLARWTEKDGIVQFREEAAADPETITLNETSAELITSHKDTGDSILQLTAEITPAEADQTVTWTSSDEGVAAVDENGLVTALTYGKVTITAETANGLKASCEIQTRYYDVADSSSYWFRHVYWAADKGITKGYGNVYFGPEENCKREQMITFLYREAGSPAVSGTVPFSDVKKGSYYYNAVLWAYNNGITKGYSTGPNKGKFGVDLEVSREDTVTFIYRMAGKPSYSTTKSFTDVRKGAYYYDAVRWAAQNGITNGYSKGPNKGKFGVGFDVLRKDIVTFLSRYDAKK